MHYKIVIVHRELASTHNCGVRIDFFPSHLQTYILSSLYIVLTRNFPNLWPNFFWQQYQVRCLILELCLRWKQYLNFLTAFSENGASVPALPHALWQGLQRMQLPVLPEWLWEAALPLGSSAAEHLGLGDSAEWRTKPPESPLHAQCGALAPV